jgi:hypothetical protein
MRLDRPSWKQGSHSLYAPQETIVSKNILRALGDKTKVIRKYSRRDHSFLTLTSLDL